MIDSRAREGKGGEEIITEKGGGEGFAPVPLCGCARAADCVAEPKASLLKHLVVRNPQSSRVICPVCVLDITALRDVGS